jgi:nucleoside-diphosphate-sugar epimerase
MRILVTGAHGFIGSHAVETLLQRRRKVRALVSPWGSLDHLAAVRDHPALEIVRADIRAPEQLAGPFRGVDAVLHAAALVADWGPWRKFRETNVNGTAHVIAAAKAGGATRLVLVSSVAVFRYSGFADRDARAHPRDNHELPYARSKILAEDLVLGERDLEGVVVRPGLWPFGPRDPNLARVVQAMRRGRLPLVGSGEARLNTAYVENLCHGLALALERQEAAGRSYMIADEDSPRWRDVLGHLAALLEVAPPRVRIPTVVAWGLGAAVEGLWAALRPKTEPPLTRYRASLMARDAHFSIEHARRELGYRPQIGWREGLERSVRGLGSALPFPRRIRR